MNKMRRADRAMDSEGAVKVLENGEFGILSTVDEKGQTYGTPLSYVFIDNKIYFHCAIEGTKLRNIENNPRVCFTVVGRTKVLSEQFSTEYESVMAFGKAEVIDGEEKIMALREIVLKYSPDFIPQGEAYIERAKDKTCVVKLHTEVITGKHRNS